MPAARPLVGPYFEGSPLWCRYAAALALFALVLIVRVQLVPVLGAHSPLLAFVLPVLAAAWLVGRGPAVLIMLLAPIACTPLFQADFRWSDPLGWLTHALFFMLVTGVAITLTHQLQMAYRRMVQAQQRGALLQSIVAACGDAIISETLTGNVNYWNAAAESLFGYEAGNIIGQSSSVTLPKELQAADTDLLSQVRNGGAVTTCETQQLRRDGSSFSAAMTLSLITDADGNPAGFCRIVRDVSEQRRALQALARSEQRFKQLADAMPQIVHVLDSNRSVLYLNQRWQEYTGHVNADSSDVEALIPAEDVQRLHEAWVHHAPQLQAYALECRLRSRTGELRWFLRRIAPIFNEHGTVDIWVDTATDIHEQKQAQSALIDADRRKDEFLAMLAHELRNPLAPILNIASILDGKSSDATAVQQMSGILKRQTTHMARLVDGLLDVSRITRGKIKIQRERLMLEAVLERALESVHPLLIAKSQAIKLVTPARGTPVQGDPVRLVQVVSNLLTNASKFSPAGSTIFVTLETGRSETRVRVRDQGTGIDRQALPHIFDLFMQADKSLDRSQGGLGIGLTIARRLMELQGGRIEAHSDGPGRGSEFVISLPLLATSLAGQSDSATRRGPVKRILVVDDNVDAATSLLMLLEMEGHDVRAAHDGQKALALLEEFPADLLLLDIGLPEIDGYALAELIRQRLSHRTPKLIALSGYAPEESLAEDRRFDAFLTKPVQLQLLLETLASIQAIGV